MTDIRNTQTVAEVIALAPADLRATQVVAEVLVNEAADLRATQVVAEVLASITGVAPSSRRRSVYIVG